MIDYKNIFRSRKLRFRILSMLSAMPDSWIVRIQYYLQMGKPLNLKNPGTFNEKIQAYKLKYRNPEMLRCTDKIEVRKYVEERGLKDILVPLVGFFKDSSELKIKSLPKQFVMKTSDGGGGNQVFICHDLEKENSYEILKKAKDLLQGIKPKKHVGREWAYDNNYPRRIIIEPLLYDGDDTKSGLMDYKFLCFNGKFKYLWVDKDRFKQHVRGFWDENLNYLKNVSCHYPTFNGPFQLPANIREMINIAERLAAGFPFVRVDLYNVKGKIYFGEMTFYPNSGYKAFNPEEFDIRLGELFDDSVI